MSLQKRLCLGVLLLFIAGLVACSSSEDKAQTRFDQARQVERGGDVAAAQADYRQLLTEFPKTKGAEQAAARLELLDRLSEKKLKAAARASMDGIRKVIDGYRAMFNEMPTSVANFDNSDYFFDSGYMAETVPQGFVLHVAFLGKSEGYRVWSLADNETTGFVYDSQSRKLTRFAKTELDQQLKAGLVEELRKGDLVFMSAVVANGKG